MLRSTLSSPEMNRKITNLVINAIREAVPGVVKIAGCEITSTPLSPTGASFIIKLNGMVVPLNETKKEETPG